MPTKDELEEQLRGAALYGNPVFTIPLSRYLLAKLLGECTNHEHDASVARTLLANNSVQNSRQPILFRPQSPIRTLALGNK